MGTRFLCTVEAPVHQNIKEFIARGSERDTLLLFRKFRNTARVFRNPVSDNANDDVVGHDDKGRLVVDVARYDPLARVGRGGYARLGPVFRPTIR